MKIFYADVSPLDNDEIFNTFFDSVSGYRQKKINAFRQRKDKNLSLGATLLLDTALREYSLFEKDMIYGEYENHKPYFKNRPDMHFNISHSGNVAVAVISESEVGIDIEKIKEFDLKIAKRFFAQEEYEFVENMPSKDERNKAFCRLWTLKESFMKITGKGMQLPLNSFCFHFENDKPSVEYNEAAGEFYFYEYDYIKGYRLAVCSQNEIKNPQIISIGFLKG